MPHEGYADSVMNYEPRIHSDMPVSELTERVTRAIKASDVSSTPLVVETMNGVTITKTVIDRGSKAGPRRNRGRLASNRARGANIDEPQRPLPNLLRSGQGHLDLLVRS